MASEPNLIQEGIAAYEAGDIDKARDLLAAGLQDNPHSEIGWLTLAKTQTDRAARRASLERVLEINPDNIEASAMLVMAGQTASGEATDALDDAPSLGELMRAASPDEPSLTLPPGLPGAPERVSVRYLREFYEQIATESVDLLSNKAVTVDTTRQTWWHVLLLTLTGGFLTGVLIVLRDILINIRALNLISVVTIPFLTTLTLAVGVAAGCYLSHWFLTTQRGGKLPLFNHSAALVMIWFPFTILNLAVIAMEPLLQGRALTLAMLLRGDFALRGGWLVATLMGMILVGYALYLMHRQLSSLYMNVDSNSLWAAAAIMLAVTALVL